MDLSHTSASFNLKNQPQVVQNALLPLKRIQNCVDDETLFNLKMLNKSLNSTFFCCCCFSSSSSSSFFNPLSYYTCSSLFFSFLHTKYIMFVYFHIKYSLHFVQNLRNFLINLIRLYLLYILIIRLSIFITVT